ncbi:unnamed protein product [Malus baccata var. baccata]
MGWPPCCDKSNVKRGLWTAAEDAKILAYVSKHGVGNWTLVPKKAFMVNFVNCLSKRLNRCGKRCRLRWTNYLRPDLKHDNFTPQEEEHIIDLHKAIGSRWSLIAKRLPGRTDNDVKNYWNTKLKKKLSKMGIDPVTHKPYSQILSDYGNISGLPSTDGNHPFSSLFKQSKSAFAPELNSSCITGIPYTNVTMNPNINGQGFSQPTNACWESHEAQITPSSSSFNWREYLLCDPFTSADHLKQEQDLMSSSENPTFGVQGSSDAIEGSSSTSMCSFVETILDQDSEMQAAFPQLLDASFDY